MPTLTNSAEGGSEDAAVTAGNSGGASGNAFDSVSITGSGSITFDNEHSRGNRAFKITGDTTNATYLNYTSSLGTVGEAWGRVYVYFTANPGATLGVVRLRIGGLQVSRFTISTSGMWQIRNASNSLLATMTSTITLNAWTRMEWHVLATAAGGDIECRLYNTADSNSITDQLSDTNAALATNIDEVNVGHHNANPVTTFWADDLNVNTTTWPGPALTPIVAFSTRQRPSLPAIQRAATW